MIVPVGAKGGFVPKMMPALGGRDAIMKEGIAAYEIFIGSLLDVTDNIEGNKIVHPVNVMRYDDDDPYFVVAADKGTATFSDIAKRNRDQAQLLAWRRFRLRRLGRLRPQKNGHHRARRVGKR